MNTLFVNRQESARKELLVLMGNTLEADQLLDVVLADLDNGEINADVAVSRLGLIDSTNSRLVQLSDLLWEAA